MKKLRILVADDHGLVRHGAMGVLNSQPGWTVVGEATDGREAVQKARELKPDVAVIDIAMPELNGVEVTRQIREAIPETKVLILTMDDSSQMVRRAMDAGATGYLLKSDLTHCLPEAVKAIAEGKRFLTPKVSEIVLDGFLTSRDRTQQRPRQDVLITLRETEIIRLLAEGKSNKEVAAMLRIAVRTVETHRSKIMLKLGIHSVAELVHYALREGVISTRHVG